jgi:hypothetical protein
MPLTGELESVAQAFAVLKRLLCWSTANKVMRFDAGNVQDQASCYGAL